MGDRLISIPVFSLLDDCRGQLCVLAVWLDAAFYELIEKAWVRYLQRLSAASLGNTTDLRTFLFGQERISLEAYRPILRDIQRGICLCCQKPLSGKTEVDHFVPWARYPADLGQNFILAHSRCNGAKSDFLAAEQYLAAWAARNREHQAELQERLTAAAIPCDPAASHQITQWIYWQTEKARGQVLVEERVLRHLGPDWMSCFAL